MGKKSKIGKRRKDKFYHLAKETGYRARSAFKLIQLNRKFQFLQQSRVLVDLCAAPGGWLQVASKHMPVSSVIIGVDLVPIKPIHNVTALQADITTPTCKQLLQRELKTWKADCILNDGAPNVGSAWIQDAFSQAELTLSALKLATYFLRHGGWFITKVFRSKDYPSLLEVFQKLFKKVHATKPQASRSESAEIFVVCQGYLAPKKVDTELLDPRQVFKEEETKGDKKMSLQRLQKRPKALGYPEGQHILHNKCPVLDFITSDDHMALLGVANQLIFDSTSRLFSRHPLTTDEIKHSCEDIKILGLKELKQLLKWREKMKSFLDEMGGSGGDEEEGREGAAKKEESEEDKMAKVDEKVKQLEREEEAEAKRLMRKQRRRRKKLEERMKEKVTVDNNLEKEQLLEKETVFSLKDIKTRGQLEEVDKGKMVDISQEKELDDAEPPRKKVSWQDDYYASRDIDSDNQEEGAVEGSDVSDLEWESEQESDHDNYEEEDEEGNPLIMPLADMKSLRSQQTSQWFSNPVFSKIGLQQDADEEMSKMAIGTATAIVGETDGRNGVAKQVATGAKRVSMETENDNAVEDVGESDNYDSGEGDSCSTDDDDDDDDSSISSDSDVPLSSSARSGKKCQAAITGRGDRFEIVSRDRPQRRLTPEGLAIGALMIQSKKKREDLIDSAYNRWTNNDVNLPSWFVEDEALHCHKQLPVSKEMVDEYRRQLKEINARPIKKIAEAKARKKRRRLRKLEQVRRKSEVICTPVDVSDREKAQQVKNMYKKAGLLGRKKPNVQYVVAKKGMGKRVRRPAGVTGRYKVVDPRMKKDNRRQKMEQKSQKKRKRSRQ